MKIIDQSVELMTPLDGDTLLKHIEMCGRTCYKSEDKITEDSARQFCQNIIKRGHEAVLEHCSFTVKFITSRGITHEIVRHRLASYCQESTRYCCYSKDKFNNEITVIKPYGIEEGTPEYTLFENFCNVAEFTYINLLDRGVKPEIARDVLPTALKTELVMTANIREWRHFLKLRTSKAAHPQIRELSNMLLCLLQQEIPVLFDDIIPEGV